MTKATKLPTTDEDDDNDNIIINDNHHNMDYNQNDEADGLSNLPNNKSSKSSLLPHGTYPLFIATLSTLGWMAGIFQDGCDFAQVQGDIVKTLAKYNDRNTKHLPPWLELGIGAYREPVLTQDNEWITNFDTSCLLYPTDIYDPFWKASQIVSFLALVVGGGGTVFLWCSTCFVFSRGTWRWTGYLLILASLSQALGFVWFASQLCQSSSSNNSKDSDYKYGGNSCSWFWGSKADVAAAVIWFFAGFLVLCRYPMPVAGFLSSELEPTLITGSHNDDDDNDGMDDGMDGDDETMAQNGDSTSSKQHEAELTAMAPLQIV